MDDNTTPPDPSDQPFSKAYIAAWLKRVDALRAEIGHVPGPTSTEMLRADRDRDNDR